MSLLEWEPIPLPVIKCAGQTWHGAQTTWALLIFIETQCPPGLQLVNDTTSCRKPPPLPPLLPRVRWKICSSSPTDYLKIIIFTFKSARLFTPTHRHLRTLDQQRMKSVPFIKNHLTFTCGIFPSFHVPPSIKVSPCSSWWLVLHFCICAWTKETQSIVLFITRAQYLVGKIFASIQSIYKC